MATGTEPRRRGRPRQLSPSEAYIARRSEIVGAAIEVFRHRGFEAGTLDDVAASLGIGRASLYHYVPSKAQLLYFIFDRAISLTLDRMDGLASAAAPAERLRILIREQVLTIAHEPAMFAVFFGDRPALEKRYEAEIVTKERRLLRHFVNAVKAASAAGLISDIEPRHGAQAILGMINWSYKWFDPQRDDPEQFAEVCERLVFGPDCRHE